MISKRASETRSPRNRRWRSRSSPRRTICASASVSDATAGSAKPRINCAARTTRSSASARPVGPQRAERELASCGQSAESSRPPALAVLTPKEYQVASLIATGATNREAASSLFLSSRTVEAHLARVYRKLGINSRAQLVLEFAKEPRAQHE